MLASPTSPRRRRGLRAGLALGLAFLVMGIAASTASAAPWVCDNAGYVVQEDEQTTGGQTWFQRVDRQPNGTYTLTRLGTLPGTSTLNALGFRVQDGFMYAWNLDNDNVFRIGTDPLTGQAQFQPLGVPIGMPPGFSTVVGTFLANGNYFVWGSVPGVGQRGLIINVTTAPDPTVVGIVGPNYDTDVYNFADFAVNPVDGELYTLTSDPAGVGLYQLILSGGQLSIGQRVTAFGAGAGAQWFSPAGANGTMIAYAGNANLQSIDLATGRVTFLGDAPDVANVDGAACANGIAVTKDVEPRTVTAGTELTYTYEVTSRALAAAPLDFVDQLPAGMTYVPGSVTVSPPVGTPNDYGGTGTLSVSGAIAPQQTVTITARVRVPPEHACDVDVDNQAQATLSVAGLPPVTVNSDDPDTPADPTDATRVRVICRADLQVVKTATTSPVVPGEQATFEFTVTNNGPSQSAATAVTDDLPDAATFVSASPGCTATGSAVSCPVGSLAVGASQTFTVTVDVASSLDECLANTATVAAVTPDPVAANNVSSICTPIRGRADLSITKTPSRTTLPPGGGQLTYSLVVRNDGPSDDPGVEVGDRLPAALTLVAADPSQGTCSTANNTVSCDLGTLRSGGSAQVLVTANAGATPGEIANVATVTGAREDPDPSNNTSTTTVTVQTPPPPEPRFDLVVSKTANDRTAVLGQPVRYRVVVRNLGPDAAPAVKFSDTLSAPVTLVSVRTTAGTCERRMPIACELGTIAAGATVTVTAVVQPRETGRRQRNAAAATGAGTDVNPANNLDAVDVRVRKIPLRLSKIASRASVTAGQTLGYRIRVQNPTRGVARNVRVCDRLPSGMVFVSSTPRARLSRGQRCWTVRRLGARQSRTYRVTVRALPGTSGRKVNRATASSRDATATRRARRPVRVLAGGVRPGGVTG